MKHRVNKAKFGFGKDANDMLLKKLASNFLLVGKMETTKHKAKAAQSAVERMVTKAKTNTEADKNYILRHITTDQIRKILVEQVAPQLKNVKSGYTRIIRLGRRMTDGADLARLEWAYPVVLESEKKAVEKKQPVKKESKVSAEEKKENKS